MITFDDYKNAGFEIDVKVERNGKHILVNPEDIFKKEMLEEVIKFFNYEDIKEDRMVAIAKIEELIEKLKVEAE